MEKTLDNPESHQPVLQAYEIARLCNSELYKCLNELPRSSAREFCEQQQSLLVNTVRDSNSTKRVTYKEFNTSLRPPIIPDSTPEMYRIAYTRLRLQAHYLKVETGRWRNVDRRQRLCNCGELQTEKHVLMDCQLAVEIRRKFRDVDFTSITTLMNSKSIFEICFNVLKAYE